MSKKTKQKPLFASLWETAINLRGSMEPGNYKHVILNLFFLKFVNDKFEQKKEQLIKEGQEKHIDKPEFYGSENVFFVPQKARWKEINNNLADTNLKVRLDKAFEALSNEHAQKLKGALPKNYFTHSGLDDSNIASLLNVIEKIETDKEDDLFGRIYQYFLLKFAAKEGKGKGEYYTPASIVKLIVSLIEPYRGRVYDPCCGSGGMFVQSVEFIKEHQEDQKEISIYGQEFSNTTYKLAKINLAIRGIEADFGEAADTFKHDQHTNLKADYIMANPPFNQENWRDEDSLKDDPRWYGYEVPPASNANYAWILHMVHKLSQNGVAGFLLANGALSAEGKEYQIRKQLVKNDLIEAIFLLPRKMFFNTDISVTLWILNRNKKSRKINIRDKVREFRDRSNEVLFMDLRNLGSPFEKKYTEFTKEDIDLISKTYHSWKSTNNKEEYRDQKGFCQSVSIEKIEKENFSLVPSRYIPFNDEAEKIDWKEKIKNIKEELSAIFQEKEVKEILKNLKF